MTAAFSISFDGIPPALLLAGMASVLFIHIYLICHVSANKDLSFWQGFFWTAMLFIFPFLGGLAYWAMLKRTENHRLDCDGKERD